MKLEKKMIKSKIKTNQRQCKWIMYQNPFNNLSKKQKKLLPEDNR